MGRYIIIGGIYNRPIAIANLTNFLIGAIALTKAALSKSKVINYAPALMIVSLVAIAT